MHATRRRVGLVDQSEVSLESFEHFGVRTEQCLVTGEQRFECRLPPREFELDAHLRLGHVSVGQVANQRVETQVRQLRQHGGALVQVDQHFALGREARQSVNQVANRSGLELTVGTRNTQWHIQLGQVGLHANEQLGDIVDAGRYVRNRAGFGVSLPERALLLNLGERLVDVRDRNARSHVFVGELAQTATGRARHIIALRRGGLDELSDRSVKHGRLESVECRAHVAEQAHEQFKFGDGFVAAQAGLSDEVVRRLEQSRQCDVVQALGELVGRLRLIRGCKACAIPG